MKQKKPFTQFIVKKNILDSYSPFFLVDVGASGGIDSKWLVYKGLLKAVGFDPLIKECERLNLLTGNQDISYISGYVGSDFGSGSPPNENAIRKNNHPGDRLSCIEANERLKVDANERYNSFQEVSFSEEKIILDKYFSQTDHKIDFLKIDTDGHDFDVLIGARQLLKNKHCLGICIESQFHGDIGDNANTFSNIDQFLRENGFTLFDLQIHKYSRRDLPGKFLISIPAQTDTGQVQWADAMYFRDLGNKKYAETWNYPITGNKLIKLASLYEFHNLHDCAIELINIHKEILKDVIDVEKAIELLVPPIDGEPATLADYQSRFNQSIFEMKFLQNGDIKQFSDAKKQDLKTYKKILLFGAGGRLLETLSTIKSYFKEDILIKVTDNDTKKWGSFIEQKEVIPPDKITDYDPDIVIIVSTYAQEILSQLFRIKDKNNLNFRITSI